MCVMRVPLFTLCVYTYKLCTVHLNLLISIVGVPVHSTIIPSSPGPRYCWLFYINPNFYGFSSSAYILLEDYKPQCVQSELECYVQSGGYILRQFSFDNINPFLNLVVSYVTVLTGMTSH